MAYGFGVFDRHHTAFVIIIILQMHKNLGNYLGNDELLLIHSMKTVASEYIRHFACDLARFMTIISNYSDASFQSAFHGDELALFPMNDSDPNQLKRSLKI